MMPLTSSCNSANDKIVFGAIGLRNMGFSNIKSFLKNPNVECAAVCDIDDEILNSRAKDIEEINEERISNGEKITQTRPTLYKDYRKMLEDNNIDAVIIGTPDHWHCLQMVDASAAGKHVYVEKPMANTIEEVLIMEKAAKKYKNVVTVGQWQRSGQHWHDAVNYVKSGALGKISRVKAWSYTSKHHFRLWKIQQCRKVLIMICGRDRPPESRSIKTDFIITSDITGTMQEA
jgi:predicted dehydrogenase